MQEETHPFVLAVDDAWLIYDAQVSTSSDRLRALREAVPDAPSASYSPDSGPAAGWPQIPDLARTRIDCVSAELQWTVAMLSEQRADADAALEALRTARHAAQEAAGGQARHAGLAGASAEASFLAADTELFAALLLFRTGHVLRGGRALVRAWSLAKQGLAHLERTQASLAAARSSAARAQTATATSPDPPFETTVSPGSYLASVRNRALLTRGFFRFFLGLVPRAFAWLLRLVGFDPARAPGKADLLACAGEARGPRAPLAGLLALWIAAFFDDDPDAAENIASTWDTRLPRSPFFLYLHGYVLRQSGHNEESFDRFERAANASHDPSMEHLRLACEYEMGWCRFAAGEWEDALARLSAFLQRFGGKSYRAYAAYQAAICCEMLDRHEDALPFCEQVLEWKRDHYSYDSFAARKAIELRDNGALCATKKALAAAQAHMDARDGARMLRALAELDSRPLDRADAVERLFWQARAHDVLGEKEQALQEYTAVWEKRHDVTSEIYIIPHALVRGAAAAVAIGERERAASLLAASKSYRSFDFDKPLHRTMAALDDELRRRRT